MRDYAKVSPQFWHGKTGKALKAQGPEAVIVALYLLTCQHANMLGLYYLAPTYIAVDTGLGMEGASKGLAGAIEAQFCRFDDDTEIVWVMEMAAYQVGVQLDPKDKQCIGIQRQYDALPENPFLTEFYERYAKAFCMTECRGKAGQKPKGLARPFKAPSKPRTGTGEGTGEGDSAPEARELSVSDLTAEGVESGIAQVWMRVRKDKKAMRLTQVAWDAVKREAHLAGFTPAQAVRTAAENNWVGFKASWLDKGTTKPANDPFAGAA